MAGDLDVQAYTLTPARVMNEYSRSVDGWLLNCTACPWRIRRTGKNACRAQWRIHAARGLHVDAWNLDYPVGTPVRFWPWIREGEPKASFTISTARMQNADQPWIWVHSHPGALILDHVEAVDAAPRGHVPPAWPELEAATR